ncbi:hypothetical protein L0F63_001796, partial [Massospora cicadina]
ENKQGFIPSRHELGLIQASVERGKEDVAEEVWECQNQFRWNPIRSWTLPPGKALDCHIELLLHYWRCEGQCVQGWGWLHPRKEGLNVL